MGATLDGVSVKRYRALRAEAGSLLECGVSRSGCRGYLAVHGGIDVPLVMGSRSTDRSAALGGYEGRALKVGDELSTLPDDGWMPEGAASAVIPEYPEAFEVRVIPGPQEDFFTESGVSTFYSTVYEVTPESDRMGIRLEGEKIESVNGTDIVSDGIVFGSVQVPSGGKPIILMADHQTTGGYAKIGTVLSFDLPKLAQARPGTKISFRRFTLREAEALYKSRRLKDAE